MRLLIALVLWVIGVGVMLYGIGNALLEISSLYQGAINNPLNQPDNAEKMFSERMIRMLIIGAAGIPFLIIGTIMVRSAAAARRRELRTARLTKKSST
jgi:hypothetical protein